MTKKLKEIQYKRMAELRKAPMMLRFMKNMNDFLLMKWPEKPRQTHTEIKQAKAKAQAKRDMRKAKRLAITNRI